MLICLFLVVLIGLAGFGIKQTKLYLPSKESKMALHPNPHEATNFVLSGMDGQKYDLVKKGKPTIIHFWTSWCNSCKTELPMLQKKYEQYKDVVQFQMVNLTVDDHPDEVKKLMQKGQYHFPVLFDFSGEVGEGYQIVSIPTTYFVDQKGMIQKKVIGAMTERQFDKLLSQIQN